LISNAWIREATKPSIPNPSYGYMWWLNTEGKDNRMSNLSANGYYAAGFGGNYIIVEPKEKLVIVLRWCEPAKANKMLGLIKKAL